GKNPAWLVESEKEMWLNIDPSVSNNWGNYRRKYSSEGTYNLRTGVTGVKPLGKSGTFSASAYYDYEYNRNMNRSMKKYPYAGEAFFYADTTKGDFRFNGPTFSFAHSLEIIDNLYLGAQINYSILAGLKKIYSYTQTVYRDVAFVGGVAYKFSDDFVLGAKYYIHDEQEKISAEDVNLLSIESYQFRGETFAIPYVAPSVSQKIKKQRNEISLQSFISPIEKLKIGLVGSYAEYDTKILVPKSQIIEAPEGYSSFGEYDAKLQAQYLLSDNVTIGIETGYNKIDNWSRNESNNLLVWEWNTDCNYFLAGGSYKFNYADLIIGVEAGVINNSADSLKYIDSRFTNIKSSDIKLKLGFELTPYNGFKLRGGINYLNKEHDFIYGADNLSVYCFTFGIGYKYLDLADINLGFGYNTYSIKNYSEINKNEINTKLTLRLFTF
nr:hypothetical protein [Melioribacteraceae bacterium]